MTLPREVVPGRDYIITLRCSERRFFLRHDEATNNAFIYCLALAASRAKMAITFTGTQSNHHHTGVHDDHGTNWIQRFAMVSCEQPEPPAPLLSQQPWMGALPAPG